MDSSRRMETGKGAKGSHAQLETRFASSQERRVLSPVKAFTSSLMVAEPFRFILTMSI